MLPEIRSMSPQVMLPCPCLFGEAGRPFKYRWAPESVYKIAVESVDIYPLPSASSPSVLFLSIVDVVATRAPCHRKNLSQNGTNRIASRPTIMELPPFTFDRATATGTSSLHSRRCGQTSSGFLLPRKITLSRHIRVSRDRHKTSATFTPRVQPSARQRR